MAATPLSVANLGRRVERAQPQAGKPPAKSKPYKIMTIISSTELQTRKALNLINIGDCCCLCHENIQRRAGEQTFFDSSLLNIQNGVPKPSMTEHPYLRDFSFKRPNLIVRGCSRWRPLDRVFLILRSLSTQTFHLCVIAFESSTE